MGFQMIDPTKSLFNNQTDMEEFFTNVDSEEGLSHHSVLGSSDNLNI